MQTTGHTRRRAASRSGDRRHAGVRVRDAPATGRRCPISKLVVARRLSRSAASLVVALAPAAVARYAAAAALGVATVVVVGSPGAAELWRHDWPLLVLAAVGLLVLARDGSGGPLAVVVLGCVLLLGAVYAVKNPGLERYFALLLPCAALLVGIAAARAPSRARPLALGVIALAAVVGFVRPIPGSRDYDVFAVIAERVEPSLPASAPLVTAAPDAYGFLLPQHAVRDMRPGVRGAILLDPAQRLYAAGPEREGQSRPARRRRDRVRPTGRRARRCACRRRAGDGGTWRLRVRAACDPAG